jgi:hypothetical protein
MAIRDLPCPIARCDHRAGCAFLAAWRRFGSLFAVLVFVLLLRERHSPGLLDEYLDQITRVE